MQPSVHLRRVCLLFALAYPAEDVSCEPRENLTPKPWGPVNIPSKLGERLGTPKSLEILEPPGI
jgi:hypothetical protein